MSPPPTMAVSPTTATSPFSPLPPRSLWPSTCSWLVAAGAPATGPASAITNAPTTTPACNRTPPVIRPSPFGSHCRSPGGGPLVVYSARPIITRPSPGVDDRRRQRGRTIPVHRRATEAPAVGPRWNAEHAQGLLAARRGNASLPDEDGVL